MYISLTALVFTSCTYDGQGRDVAHLCARKGGRVGGKRGTQQIRTEPGGCVNLRENRQARGRLARSPSCHRVPCRFWTDADKGKKWAEMLWQAGKQALGAHPPVPRRTCFPERNNVGGGYVRVVVISSSITRSVHKQVESDGGLGGIVRSTGGQALTTHYNVQGSLISS